MSYIAPAKNHVGIFCSKCGRYYGHKKGTSVTTCGPCKKKEKSKD